LCAAHQERRALVAAGLLELGETVPRRRHSLLLSVEVDRAERGVVGRLEAGLASLVKGVNPLVPGDVLVAGLIVNIVLGAALVYLVGSITREVFNVVVAQRAMALTASFPGSYVLSFAYAEALLLVLAAACVWCLLRERWWWAGVAGALATFTRPNGLAVVAACLAAAIASWRSTRSMKPFVAPLLAPLGFVAFQLFVGWRAGEQGVWFRVQREAWKENTSFGLTAVRDLGEFLVRPFSSPTNAVTGATVVVLALLLWCLWKARLPLPLVAHAVAVVVLMLLPETVTARPRFAFTAFPLLIAAAKVWPERQREAWSYVTAVCGAGLVTLSALYGLDQVVIP
jgi:hypothetical protein